MRLVTGGSLAYRAAAALLGKLEVGPTPMLPFQIGFGILLILGLWTPVAGTLVALTQIVYIVLGTGDPWIHVLLGTLGLSLALLGPGAWSVDAWLFGWRRIDIRDRQGRPRSSSES
jgi:uncharacterized membrane protein YphA (DoxX/SURF4 family)